MGAEMVAILESVLSGLDCLDCLARVKAAVCLAAVGVCYPKTFESVKKGKPRKRESCTVSTSVDIDRRVDLSFL